jgi:hypothetical membrane protein
MTSQYILILCLATLACWLTASLVWECCSKKKGKLGDVRMFASVKFKHVIFYLVSMTCLMLGSTYWLCLAKSQCKPLPNVPSVSVMFDYFPGNIMSRMFLSQIGLTLGLSQIVFWNSFGIEYNGTKVGSARRRLDEIFLFLGGVGAVCLNIVGAVCNNEKNIQCQGNEKIHNWSSGIFFVVYMIKMLVLSGRSHFNKNKYFGILLFLALLSCLLKLRLLPHLFGQPKEPNSFSSLLEWIDILSILLWTSLYFTTTAGNGFALQIRQQTMLNRARGDTVQLANFSVTPVFIFVFVIVVSTVTVSQIFASGGDRLFLSDTFLSPPGNMIARFALPLVASIAVSLQICVYYIEGIEFGEKGNLGRNHFIDKSIAMLAFLSFLGLALMGCSSQTESFLLHKTGAGIFYMAYGVHMLAHSIRSFAIEKKCSNKYTICQLLIAILSCICTGFVATSIPKFMTRPRPRPTTLDKLTIFVESTNLFCVFIYMGICIFKYKARKSVGISIIHLGKGNEEDQARLL